MSDPATAPNFDILEGQLMDRDRRRALLLQAVSEAQNRFRDNPTEANLRSWKAVEAEIEQLSGIRPSSPDATGPEQDFNGVQAVIYLQEQGYKVAKTKFYDDAKIGKIGKTTEGRFTGSALDSYGKAHCKLLAGLASRDERIAELVERKLKAETRSAEYKEELDGIKAKIASGHYVEAASRDRFLAERLQRLKDDTKASIHAHAARKIELVGGDPARQPELIAFEIEIRAAWLRRYAAEATQGRTWVTPQINTKDKEELTITQLQWPDQEASDANHGASDVK